MYPGLELRHTVDAMVTRYHIDKSSRLRIQASGKRIWYSISEEETSVELREDPVRPTDLCAESIRVHTEARFQSCQL